MIAVVAASSATRHAASPSQFPQTGRCSRVSTAAASRTGGRQQAATVVSAPGWRGRHRRQEQAEAERDRGRQQQGDEDRTVPAVVQPTRQAGSQQDHGVRDGQRRDQHGRLGEHVRAGAEAAEALRAERAELRPDLRQAVRQADEEAAEHRPERRARPGRVECPEPEQDEKGEQHRHRRARQGRHRWPRPDQHVHVPPGEHRPLPERADLRPGRRGRGPTRVGGAKGGLGTAPTPIHPGIQTGTGVNLGADIQVGVEVSIEVSIEVSVQTGLGQPVVEQAHVRAGRRPAGRVRARGVGQQTGRPRWRRNGRGGGETRDRSGKLGEAAGPGRRRVAETSQPLVDLVEAVGREVVAGGVRRAEERQVPAGGEDGHLVAADRVERVLRGEHDRDPALAQAAQAAHDLGPLGGVEADRGLLEEELRRLGQQLGRDGGALALARVQLPDAVGRARGQVDRAQHLGRGALVVAGPAQRGRVPQHPVKRELRVDRVRVGDVSGAPAGAGRPPGRAGHRSRGRRAQSRHRVEQRRLPRSAAADDRHQLAMANSQ